jgi:hypothetical protein
VPTRRVPPAAVRAVQSHRAHADPPPSFSTWPQIEPDPSLSSLFFTPRAHDFKKPSAPECPLFCALRPSSSTVTPPCLRCKLVRPISGTGHRATPPVWEPPLPPPRPHGELRFLWVFSPKFPPLLTSPLFTSAPCAGHHLHRPPQLIPDPWNVAVPLRRRLGASPSAPPCPTFPPFHA